MSAASDEMTTRLRPLLGAQTVEKKLFGGSGFMLDGNMVAGATAKGELLVRVDPARMNEALERPGAHLMHMGPRHMTGFVAVAPDAVADAATLRGWVDYALGYVRTMPAK